MTKIIKLGLLAITFFTCVSSETSTTQPKFKDWLKNLKRRRLSQLSQSTRPPSPATKSIWSMPPATALENYVHGLKNGKTGTPKFGSNSPTGTKSVPGLSVGSGVKKSTLHSSGGIVPGAKPGIQRSTSPASNRGKFVSRLSPWAQRKFKSTTTSPTTTKTEEVPSTPADQQKFLPRASSGSAGFLLEDMMDEEHNLVNDPEMDNYDILEEVVSSPIIEKVDAESISSTEATTTQGFISTSTESVPVTETTQTTQATPTYNNLFAQMLDNTINEVTKLTTWKDKFVNQSIMKLAGDLRKLANSFSGYFKITREVDEKVKYLQKQSVVSINNDNDSQEDIEFLKTEILRMNEEIAVLKSEVEENEKVQRKATARETAKSPEIDITVDDFRDDDVVIKTLKSPRSKNIQKILNDSEQQRKNFINDPEELADFNRQVAEKLKKAMNYNYGAKKIGGLGSPLNSRPSPWYGKREPYYLRKMRYGA